ncbi:MAG: bacterio-opsin activator domain-containing protein [Haloarculaceae archaeon]
MVITNTEPAGHSVELEFEVHDNDLFFVRASGEASCRVALAEMIHRSDGRLLEYFTVEGANSDHVLTAAERATSIDEARVVRNEQTEGELLYEFLVDGPCIGGTLADEGALVRDVVAVDGVGRVVADVPPHADARQVVETVQARHDTTLVATRERDRQSPDFTRHEFRATLTGRLTERQLETLLTAYQAGYFAWPRESTAETCATALDISQPTFTQHLRMSQQKLLDALFDEAGASDWTDMSTGTGIVTHCR